MSTRNTNTTNNIRWRTTTPTTPLIMKLGLEEAEQLTIILTMNDRSCPNNVLLNTYAMS